MKLEKNPLLQSKPTINKIGITIKYFSLNKNSFNIVKLKFSLCNSIFYFKKSKQKLQNKMTTKTLNLKKLRPV